MCVFQCTVDMEGSHMFIASHGSNWFGGKPASLPIISALL